jgi:hypothetical protein
VLSRAVPWRSYGSPRAAAVTECPICSANGLEYAFVVDKVPVCRCAGCGLMFLNPQPPPAGDGGDAVTLSPGEAAELFRLLEHYRRQAGHRVLVVNAAGSAIAIEASARCCEVVYATRAALERVGGDAPWQQEFDSCVLYACLEKSNNPERLLRSVRRVLKSDGVLLVTAASLDSRAAALLRNSWWEFSGQNLFYFGVNTLQNLLIKAGFGSFSVHRDHGAAAQRQLENAATRRRTLAGRLLAAGNRYLPGRTSRRLMQAVDSRVVFLGSVTGTNPRPRLSVIMPVYNEGKTVHDTLGAVLGKELEGVDIEVIVVESNSTDGSREEVLKFASHPRVRIVLEDAPGGKGRAVRKGLKEATGDIVLIQDADLEYDIDDYDALVRPLVALEQNFVIGSRHGSTGKTWKIRQFHGSTILSWFFNLGHLFFLTLFNWIYWQTLNDPFSMYKVFRRDCVYGLSFECNRFDFDFELVIKLLRKGYRPVEIPVNYRSRSLAEGKKVTLVGDPLTWIRALVRFRFTALYASDAVHAEPDRATRR